MIIRPLRYRAESGQSTVEFALVLPLVVLLLLGLLQVGVLVKDQLLVLGAAREGVREAIVNADHAQIETAAGKAAPGLPLRLLIERGKERGDPAKVVVTASPTKLPLVGQMVAGVTLKAAATMRLERSDDAP
ncbi:MAG: TadE/TadG family type IV pilus assembly protein [Actinomycetota bacterium]